MPSSPDDAPCGTCQLLVCRGQKGLECDVCGFWYHIECAAVSTTCYNAIRKADGLVWFCPTCLSTLQSVFQMVEALSAENAVLREEIREIRLAVEPPTSVRNCDSEVEQIWPADCNSRVKSSHSCPAVSNRCAESVDALHPLPPKPKEGAKNARHPPKNQSRMTKDVAQGHTRQNISDDLPEIRFLRNVDKSLSVEEIKAALHRARVRTDDCFIEQTVSQEDFKGCKKFVRITLLPNRMRSDEFAGQLKHICDFKWQFSRKPPVVKLRESSNGHDANKPTKASSGLLSSSHSSVSKHHFWYSGPPRPTRPPLPPPQLQPGLLPLPPSLH